MKSDENCFRYTGVPTIAALHAIYNWIDPAAQSVKLWDGKNKLVPGRQKGRIRKSLTLFKEYLLTLVRIRRDFYNYSPFTRPNSHHSCSFMQLTRKTNLVLWMFERKIKRDGLVSQLGTV